MKKGPCQEKIHYLYSKAGLRGIFLIRGASGKGGDFKANMLRFRSRPWRQVGKQSALHRLNMEKFQGNPGLCGEGRKNNHGFFL